MIPFKFLVRKAIDAYIRELQDGCCDCMDSGSGFCKTHSIEVEGLAVEPGKNKAFQEYFAPIKRKWEADIAKQPGIERKAAP